ncbi:SRPBCC domain-containing protein [Gordonia liuliyuniae]|uniref:SRPBCC domain-containing protein n=1 Tax=Gordonia liuliyuniae TaxID=2911517 RepID=A0ABS9IVY7_9ACTN|nr:SRPBCC domain-containing protein [Gordonia liuliyuniae]MCF8589718.1 SRPBCC domain-containing protein [Gordonia liuliyuniae]
MSLVTDNSIEIDAPADVVWSVLTDFDAYHEWNPFQLDCSTTLTPGAPIDMKVDLGPRPPMRQREFIDEVDEDGRWFTYRMKPAPFRLITSLRRQSVVDLGDGRSRYDSHFEINGPLSVVVKALMGRELVAKFTKTTEAVGRRAAELAP